MLCLFCSFIFFFNDTATTEIYTLSLHDALPILLMKNILLDCFSERPSGVCCVLHPGIMCVEKLEIGDPMILISVEKN